MSKISEWAEIQSTILDGTPLDELPPLERLIHSNEPADVGEGFQTAKEFRDDLQALVDEYEEQIAELKAQLTETKGSFDLAYKYIQETDNDLDFEVFKGEESQGAQEFSIVEDDGTEHFDTPESQGS